MSHVNWKLGELLRLKLEEHWTSYRVSEFVNGGLNLVDSGTGQHSWRGTAELVSLWGFGRLRRERAGRDKLTDVARRLLEGGNAGENDSERRHRRWIAPYIMAFRREATFKHASRRKLEALIKRVADEQADKNPPHWRTLSNHIKTWKAGLATGSVLKFAIRARGNRQKRFKGFEPQIDELLQKHVFKKERASMKEVLSHLQTALDAYNLAATPDQRVDAKFQLSERTVQRRIQSYSNDIKVLAAKGKKAVREQCTLVGDGPEAAFPLEMVLMDHTELDILVVHPATGKVLGRPVITAAMDLYSRMIVGLHIGFEEPGYRTVSLCLRSAMRTKDEILAKYGLDPKGWPCFGRFLSIVLDNGSEFHGSELDDATMQLQIDVTWCRAETPTDKGPIERWFKRLNIEVIHTLPGTTFSNPEERGDYDSEGMACLTIARIREIVIRWLVTDYSVDIHEGISKAPIVRFLEGQVDTPPDLCTEVEDFDILLLNAKACALTRQGIRLDGRRYGGAERNERLQYLLNDPNKPDLCVIKQDPDNMGLIYLLDWQTSRYVTVKADDFADADGLTMREHQVAAESSRRQVAAYQAITRPQLNAARVDNRRKIEQLAAEGKLRGRKGARLTDADADIPLRPLPKAVLPLSGIATAAAGRTPAPGAAELDDEDLGITIETIT